MVQFFKEKIDKNNDSGKAGGGSVCLQIPVSGGTAAVFLRILCLGRRCFAFDSWPRGEGKEKWSAVGIFALLALFVLPVAITLLTGMAQPIRAHLTYALVFAGYLFLLCAHFPKLFAKWKRLRIAAYAAVAAISLIISWRQMVSVNKD